MKIKDTFDVVPGTSGHLLRAALVALAVGCVGCLPDLLMARLRRFYQEKLPEVAQSWTLDGSYTPFACFDDYESCVIASRVHEATRKAWPGDPYIKEAKSRRLAVTDIASFMALGLITRLGKDFARGWLLARAVGGALWVFALYLLFMDLCGKPRYSLAVAVLLTFGNDLLNMTHGSMFGALGVEKILHPIFYLSELIGQVARHIFYFYGHYPYYFGVTRLYNPALTYPPFFLTFLLAARAASRPTKWNIGLGGILGGLLIYVHPDVGSAYLTAMPFFVFFWSVKQKRFCGGLSCFFLLSVLVATPWLVFGRPDPELLVRFGSRWTQEVSPWGLVWAACFVPPLLIWGRHPFTIAVAAVLSGVALITESQVVIGQAVAGIDHWHVIGICLVYILAAGWVGRRLARDWNQAFWAIALLFLWAIARGIGYAALRFPYQAMPRDHDRAFEYLNRHTPPDSVVAALGPIEVFSLPVYTHNKVLVGCSTPLNTDLPADAQMRRLRRNLDLLGIPMESLARIISAPDFEKMRSAGSRDLWTGKVNWWSREFQTLWYFNESATPREFVRDLRSSSPDLNAEVNYIWVGPFERRLMSEKAFRSLGRPLYQNRTIAIFPMGASAP